MEDLETQPPLTEDDASPSSFARFRQRRKTFGSTASPMDEPLLAQLVTNPQESAGEEEKVDDLEENNASCDHEDDDDSVASSPFRMTAGTQQHDDDDMPLEADDDDDALPSSHQKEWSLSSDGEEEKEEPFEEEKTHDDDTSVVSSPEETPAAADIDDDEDDNAMETEDKSPTKNDDDPTKDSETENVDPSTEEEPVNKNDTTMTNNEPSSPTSCSPTKDNDDTPKYPDHESLISSTDQLFAQVTDKQQVTVKDILQSLQVEYDCPKFDKASKKVVRDRLTALIALEVENDEEEDDDEASSSSEEEHESESEASGAEADDDSDFETAPRRKPKSTKPKKKTTPSKPSGSKRKARKSAAAIKAAAVRVQAEQLRKQRLEALRIRNEELQLMHSREEQQRATQIASKLETDTQEIRRARLEQRLDLLQKLDEKRFNVIQQQASSVVQKATQKDQIESKAEPVQEKAIDEQSDNDGDEEESSDDDMELEFVGNKPTKPLASLKSNALSLLSWADRGVRPLASKKDIAKTVASSQAADATTDEFLSLLNQTKQTTRALSPGQSMNARAFLKKRLLSQQRRMGNHWLARELGYQNEQEHVQDCLKVENQKRLLTLQKEQERIKANERRLLRERWMQAEEEGQFDRPNDEEDPDDEDYKEPGENEEDEQVQIHDEEEDEEVAMARELGQMEEGDSNDPPDTDEGDAGDDNNSASAAPTTVESHIVNDGALLVATEAVEGSRDSESDEKDTASLPTALVSAENSQEDEVPETLAAADSLPPSGDDGMDNTTVETCVMASAPAFETQPPMSSNGVDTTTHDFETQPPVAKTDTEAFETAHQFETQPPPTASEDGTPVEDNEETQEAEPEKPKGPRNSAWREMLKREAEKVKKMKKRKGEMIDDEADEEEEEEIVGLEDFGFAMHKKKKSNDDENEGDNELDEDDLENVVDDVSDGEGDEEAGDEARKAMQMREEKERHKEIIRRMRDGYDGRRGGIAGGGAGARGVHRFDQLVAADNREDAKRLGLLNDDEMDSDDEKEEKPEDDEEEDEAALLDKLLKDRFLHRSSVEMEENFSEDEEEDEENADEAQGEKDEDLEEKEQERMAKRFTKRARMQRLIEAHGHEEEFSQMRLIEEDTTLQEESQKIRNGLVRKRSQSNSILPGEASNLGNDSSKRQKVGMTAFVPTTNGSSLALALQANRRKQTRTSFLRDTSTGSSYETTASFQRSVGFRHVIFQSSSSAHASSRGASQSQSSSLPGVRSSGFSNSSSLWSNVSRGFQKRH